MWNFRLPTQINFGPGRAGELPALAAARGKRPLVVTDSGLRQVPAIATLAAGIAGESVFSRVEPNPTVENVDDLAETIRAGKHDVLVAIGGGSAMDCAKAAGALVATPEKSIRRFHAGELKLEQAGVPLIAVPTTAGTGAEVTPFAVLDDRQSGRKAPLAGDCLYPALAVVDPDLTLTLPLKVTAAGGLDALSHALEGYWSKNHQPICDLLAKEAARLFFTHFPTVCRTPGDRTARTGMSQAALLAGLAFQLPKNAMVHACSYPLSSQFHLPHGTACAFTLEFAVRHNAPALNGRLEELAVYCGLSGVDELVARIVEAKRLGGLPRTLAEAGIPETAVEELIAASFHPLMNNNPAPVTPDDLRRMYRELAA